MLALIATPAFKSGFEFEYLRHDRASEAEKVARLITSLHGVLVKSDVAPEAVAAAKSMLLGVLERAKGRAPFLIVPPLETAGQSRPDMAPAQPLAATSQRGMSRSKASVRSSSPQRSGAKAKPRAESLGNTQNVYAQTNAYLFH
jgi:hypothetical protein